MAKSSFSIWNSQSQAQPTDLSLSTYSSGSMNGHHGTQNGSLINEDILRHMEHGYSKQQERDRQTNDYVHVSVYCLRSLTRI
jgi:hypothetical protein